MMCKAFLLTTGVFALIKFMPKEMEQPRNKKPEAQSLVELELKGYKAIFLIVHQLILPTTTLVLCDTIPKSSKIMKLLSN